jgi:hypothetical protein
MKKIGFSLLPLILLLTACQGGWVRVNQDNRLVKVERFEVTLPTGWVRTMVGQQKLVVTRDGVPLQNIDIAFRSHEEAFKKLEKESDESLLPSELAELYLADMRARDEHGLPSLQVLENAPDRIGGVEGFRLHLLFTASSGLVYEQQILGFVNTKGFYTLSYRAPKIHYYDDSRQGFDQVRQSFRVL